MNPPHPTAPATDAGAFRPPAQPCPGCALCEAAGGVLVYQTPRWRVIRAEDCDHPAFYRVVWREHVGEFSALPAADRLDCMEAVVAVERTLLAELNPRKINLAAFGNRVAHLHWHVTARFDWDRHFPEPVWGPPQREVQPPAVQRLGMPLANLDEQVRAAVCGLRP